MLQRRSRWKTAGRAEPPPEDPAHGIVPLLPKCWVLHCGARPSGLHLWVGLGSSRAERLAHGLSGWPGLQRAGRHGGHVWVETPLCGVAWPGLPLLTMASVVLLFLPSTPHQHPSTSCHQPHTPNSAREMSSLMTSCQRRVKGRKALVPHNSHEPLHTDSRGEGKYMHMQFCLPNNASETWSYPVG